MSGGSYIGSNIAIGIYSKSNIISKYNIVCGSQSFHFSDETSLSKDFLLEVIMKRYDITQEELKSLSVIKSKLRNSNIDEILN